MSDRITNLYLLSCHFGIKLSENAEQMLQPMIYLGQSIGLPTDYLYARRYDLGVYSTKLTADCLEYMEDPERHKKELYFKLYGGRESGNKLIARSEPYVDKVIKLRESVPFDSDELTWLETAAILQFLVKNRNTSYNGAIQLYREIYVGLPQLIITPEYLEEVAKALLLHGFDISDRDCSLLPTESESITTTDETPTAPQEIEITEDEDLYADLMDTFKRLVDDKVKEVKQRVKPYEQISANDLIFLEGNIFFHSRLMACTVSGHKWMADNFVYSTVNSNVADIVKRDFCYFAFKDNESAYRLVDKALREGLSVGKVEYVGRM